MSNLEGSILFIIGLGVGVAWCRRLISSYLNWCKGRSVINVYFGVEFSFRANIFASRCLSLQMYVHGGKSKKTILTLWTKVLQKLLSLPLFTQHNDEFTNIFNGV